MSAYQVVDVFCGVGGLTLGFYLEGFTIVAGIDSDPFCKYAYEKNNHAKFIQADVSNLDSKVVADLFAKGKTKILVGCAPCQPFSNYTNKLSNKDQDQWALLRSFGRIIQEVQPEIVSMENVPSLASKPIFKDFIKTLQESHYHVWWSSVFCADYGVPQQRTRLVLLASKLGAIEMIPPTHIPENYITVRATIGHLPPVEAGKTHESDGLHRAGIMSALNMERIKNSIPGGTWRDWNPELVAKCHIRESGESYYNVYGRMEWGKISPTITTQFTGFGNGRFGHPEQNRGLSLREGALLQTFPADYEFFEPGSPYYLTHVARHIGNAVPVALARAIAKSIEQHLIHETNHPPPASSDAALRRMKAAKPRDTAPEKALRAILEGLGLKYSVDVSPLKGLRRIVDILFETERVAVLVDGCFWHGCPIHGTWPKENAEFWREKIEANKLRDADTDRRLIEAGWKVIRVWEHEDPKDAANKIAAALS
jgi:DNA (cytosine-5)-methyltransferase 1